MQAHCEQEHLIDLVAVFSRVVPLPSSVILALPDPAKTAVKPPGAFQVRCITLRLGWSPSLTGHHLSRCPALC